MRTALLFLFISFCQTHVQGQIPEQKNRALVHKTTATWCYPCGTWGWELSNNVVNGSMHDDIVYLALFNSPSGGYNNSNFFNSTAVTLAFNFRYSTWPSFGVNGHNLSNINNNQATAIERAIYDSVSMFKRRPVIANTASIVSIHPHGGIEISAKVKFFEDSRGEFYLATYLVEDGAINLQNGQSGPVEHRGVLRAAVESLDWGDLIATGDIDAGQTVSKFYNYTVPDENWDLSKLTVYNIIWKKVGTSYEYVNGSISHPASSNIITKSISETRIELSPNPVKDFFQLQFSEIESIAHVSILDVSGRVLHESNYEINSRSGYTFSVDTRKWRNGLYNVNIYFKDEKEYYNIKIIKK